MNHSMNRPIPKKAGKLTIAATAAVLFASVTAAPVFAADSMDSGVKCMGVNACKGQSKCKTAANACAGQNSCKGKGWLVVPSADECAKQGGTVIK